MFGMRTPMKKVNKTFVVPQHSPKSAEKAGPSHEQEHVSKVRRSIGEWETVGSTKNKSLTPPTSTPNKTTVSMVGPLKPNEKVISSQEGTESNRRPSAEAIEDSPSKTKYASRTAEARACLNKAKLYLEKSRNLRTDIKAEVTKALERLYQLVKEGEKEGTNQKQPKEKVEEINKTIEEEKPDTSRLLCTLAENSRLVTENNKKMEELKQEIERHREILNAKTYASVVTTSHDKEPPKQTALHSIVVTSKDTQDTSELVLNRIRDVIDAKEGWIKVEKVRKAKDKKVIVCCKTLEEREKVKDRLKIAQEHLSVEDIKNKDPLLALKNVLNYHTDDDLVKALKNQNREIFSNAAEETFEIKYRRKVRNPHQCHVVMKVSPPLWQKLIRAGTVNIDLQKIHVEDQSPLVQCSICLGYGHGRKYCKDKLAKCSHCGGPHMKTECEDWLTGVVPRCCNCLLAKLDNTSHNAFSQECPVRRRWDALARATIAYC